MRYFSLLMGIVIAAVFSANNLQAQAVEAASTTAPDAGKKDVKKILEGPGTSCC